MPSLPLDAALNAVTHAMTVCRYIQRRLDDVRAMTKDDRSPVTIADYASQAAVASALSESLGDVRLVGEESAAFLRQPQHAPHLAATREALRDSGVWPDATDRTLLNSIELGSGDPEYDSSRGFWTLDPIDGTKGFLRGEQYAVCLALIVKGQVRIGVLGCPNLRASTHEGVARTDDSNAGSMYVAVQGHGAAMHSSNSNGTWSHRSPIHCATLALADPARLAESVESSHTKHNDSEALLAKAWPAGVTHPIRMDSQCKYALVARGDAHAYLRMPTKRGYVERIWDHAAGALIAQEAGCVVTDLFGKPLDFGKGRGLEANLGICAAVPPLHKALVRTARDTFQTP